MARGIRILNGDFVVGDTSDVTAEGSVLVTMGGSRGLRRVGDSAAGRETLCIGDDADAPIAFRLSMGEGVGTEDGMAIVVPAREREALVTRVGVEEVEGANFGR